MALTNKVPVTARPRGVVLKYARPAVVIWKAPQASAAKPSSTSAALQSTRRAISAPYSLALSGTVSIFFSSY